MAFDDYPDGESRRPPNMRLYEAVTSRYAADVQTVKEVVVEQHGGLEREDVRQFVEGGEHEDIMNVHYTDVKHPFHLDGSEVIRVDHINAPARSTAGDGFVMMNVSLYADGSLFMREEDLKYVGTDLSETYTVFLTPERDPFIVALQELEGYMGPDRLEYSPYSYLEYLRQQGQSARDLNDTESQEILDILPQLEVDLGLTIAESL